MWFVLFRVSSWIVPWFRQNFAQKTSKNNKLSVCIGENTEPAQRKKENEELP
jgi:hypothetical protein